MLSKFEDSTLAIRTSGDGDNVVGILDGGNDTSGEDDFLPDFANIDNVNTYWIDIILINAIIVFETVHAYRLVFACRHRGSCPCHSSLFQDAIEQTTEVGYLHR